MTDVPFSHAGAADSWMWASQLSSAGFERATLVGTSLGARVALEFALESADRVSVLVLVSPGLGGHDWSEEVQAFGAEENAALQRGDLDAAVDASLRLWLAGPRRGLDAIDPAVRHLVAEMQSDAFRLQRGHELRMVPLDPPASTRCPRSECRRSSSPATRTSRKSMRPAASS